MAFQTSFTGGLLGGNLGGNSSTPAVSGGQQFRFPNAGNVGTAPGATPINTSNFNPQGGANVLNPGFSLSPQQPASASSYAPSIGYAGVSHPIVQTPATQTIKKQVTNPDGTQETHYNDPSSGAGTTGTGSTGSTGIGSTGTTGGGSTGTTGGTTPPVPPQVNNPYTPLSIASIGGAQGGSAATYGQGYDNTQKYYNQISDAAKQLAALQSSLANTIPGQIKMGGVMPVLSGEEAALQEAYGGQEQALSSEIGNLGGILNTAAGQQGTGITGLLGAGNTAISGQGQTLPQQNFPFTYNPLTGQFTSPGVKGGGSGTPNLTFNPTTDAKTLAQAVMNKQISFSDAVAALRYGGRNPTAQAQLTQEILNDGGNPTQLQAQAAGAAAGAAAVAGAAGQGQAAGISAVAGAGGQAQAQNITTAGTTPTGTYGTIYTTAKTNSANFATAQNNINTLGNSIFNFMSSDPGINNLGAQALNTKLNQVSTQFNSPQYAQFNAQIAGLQRAISQYIQAGEIPSASTAAAQSIVDGSISLGALGGALTGINTDLAAAKSAQDTTAQNALQNMQGSTGTGAGSGASGGWSSLGDR